ncbi:MAG: SET domain-containing protein-lysine N-methyltransferase [Bacteroidota bacterium]
MSSLTEYDIVCTYPCFEVRQNPSSQQQGLFATRSFELNERLIEFSIRSIQATPTYLTVQIGENEHFEFEPDHLKYLNHSCDPNVFIDLDNLTLIAIKPIRTGEELRFFYPSTEWKMDQPFECACRSNRCLGTIAGAQTLSNTELSNYKLSPFIQQKLNSPN